MNAVLGIDLGTSYFKAGVFDEQGRLLGLSRKALTKDRDDSGHRCEVPAERFWATLRGAVAAALEDAEVLPSDVQGVGYSSQTNSFLLLDTHDRPLTPLLIWQDLRARLVPADVERLWQREDFLQVTGLGATGPEFAVAKVAWLRENEPQLWRQLGRILSISDYLVFTLTGNAIGDADTAAMLGLLDMRANRWWDEALNAVNIESHWLAEPERPGRGIGQVTAAGSHLLGGQVPSEIPLVAGGLDHHLAAMGAGLGLLADMAESNGTASCCLHVTRDYDPKPGCCMGVGFEPDTFTQFAFSENGASSLEWYQQRFAPNLTIEELLKQAEAVEPGAGGLIAKPQAMQYEGRTGFLNVKPRHGHEHFVRAILESTAATLLELVERLTPSQRPARILATGGGARSPLWLQIKADMLGTQFVQADCEEPACRGAAMCASVAADWFPSLDTVADQWVAPKRIFLPRRKVREDYKRWLTRYRDAIEIGEHE